MTDFKKGRYFVKTEFHEKFVPILHRSRQDSKLYIHISGIQGLGKTSSVIYYVLECRKNQDYGVHYIDLNEIVKKDRDLEKFSAFSEKYQTDDCLIIDHVSVDNSHYMDKIKEVVKGKIDKFILIETGLTACAHSSSLVCGKDLQLNEEYFLQIWNGSLQVLKCRDSHLSGKGQKADDNLSSIGEEVYAVFSQRFIMTPRLLHEVLEYLFRYNCIGKTVYDALADYTKRRRREIADFKGSSGELYAKFVLHTTILLSFITDKDKHILTEKQAAKIMMAINIFEIEYMTVTKDDMCTNLEFSRLDLKEGDVYVRVRHLVPFLADQWRERLPYNLQVLLEQINTDEIFSIMFQSGGARKEFEKLLIKTQREINIAITPKSRAKTIYEPSQNKQTVLTTSDCVMTNISSEKFMYPEHSDMDPYLADVPEAFKGFEKNVALYSVYMKQLAVTNDRFVLYPHIEKLMGFDYFIYLGDEKIDEEQEDCPPSKKPKTIQILYAVQVATGATHRGDSIGQALEVVKKIFSDTNIKVHAVVITARSDSDRYILTKCKFSNITVINLHGKNLQTIMEKNTLLHQFYLQLIKTNVPSKT